MPADALVVLLEGRPVGRIERVLDLAGRIPPALERAIADDDVAAINSDLPQRLLDLVAARTAHCATILDRPRPSA